MVPQSVLTQDLVLRICREYRIMSCDIIVREDASIDQLIDVIDDIISRETTIKAATRTANFREIVEKLAAKEGVIGKEEKALDY